MRPFRLLVLLAALAGAPLAGAAPRPFTLSEGQVIIMVSLNGREVPALLDTGATRSLIEMDLAKELGIRVQKLRSGGTVGVGGDLITYGYTREQMVDLGAGPMRRRLGAYPAGRDIAAENVRLLIGMDMLDDLAITLDFAAMTVDFHRSTRFTPPDDAPLKLTASGWHRPTLPVILGGRKADMLLDTAASVDLHLDSSFVAATPPLSALPVSRRLIAGIDGVHQHEAITIPHFTLGDETFTDVPASYASFAGMRAANDMDGIIGVGLLRHFSLVIDFGRRQLWMTPLPRQ